ncbi:magnesium transporter [Candidatus Bathyarchaeota archaeon]|nr:magnesium transporter [Candidatus Bathyarchaeota archaeon]
MSHAGISKSFLAMFKETSITYLFEIAGLLAGFLVAYQLGVFKFSPWAIALYPALISTKVISGLLSGRLSTALHLGTIHPRFSGNTKSFYKLIDAMIVLTLATSLSVSLIALFLGYLFWGITLADFSAILTVMISTLAMGLFFSLLTIKMAFVTFKRGLDPDVIVYPIMSTAVSIFITLCYILVLNLFFYSYFGRLALIIIGFVHVILVLYLLSKDRREAEFIKTLRESLVMMVFVALMVTITGTVFRQISIFAGERKEIYTIYPVLINLVSAVGLVVGSTASTKLALGLLSPSFSSIKNHAKNIFSAWGSSLIIFTVLALISIAVNQVFSLTNVIDFILIVWFSNVIAVVVISLLSFGISILTFKRGLDLDNFVDPVEASLAAIVTSIALLLALLLII